MKATTLLLTPIAVVWPFIFYILVFQLEPSRNVGLMLGYIPFALTVALLGANVFVFIKSMKKSESTLMYPLVCSGFLVAGALGQFISIVTKLLKV